MTTGYRIGLRAERIAALYLRCKGYRILGHRYKTPVGEIDLIARRGRTLVFVEVKARKSMEESLYAIQPHQARRIARAAQYYMTGRGHADHDCRFDAILMAGLWRIRHIRNIV